MENTRSYARKKRNKKDRCNICGRVSDLTWDHVPPKFCFNDERTQYNSIFEINNKKQYMHIAQNGIKYRSICAECNNNLLGSNYDKEYKKLVDLLYKLYITPGTIPQYLARAILPTYTIIANSEATSNHSCLDGIKYGDRQPGSSTDEVMINSRTDGFGAHIKRRFILGNLALATENQERMFRKAQRVRRLIVEELNKIYSEYDIILTPNSGSVAPKLDEANDDRLSDEYIILENHLALGNFAGTPSISIPSGFSDKMPIAVNLMGRVFEEQTVLNAAYALEQALGFANQYSREG